VYAETPFVQPQNIAAEEHHTETPNSSPRDSASQDDCEYTIIYFLKKNKIVFSFISVQPEPESTPKKRRQRKTSESEVQNKRRRMGIGNTGGASTSGSARCEF
jgi:hypothetical protein